MGKAADQLERGNRITAFTPGKRQKVKGRIRSGDGNPCGRDMAGLWKQFQTRLGDNAKRPFGPDKQIAQVIAGIILAQFRKPVPHAAIGQNNLKPQHQIAGIAIPDDVQPAGIGRKVAANLAGALCAKAKREDQITLKGGLLKSLQDRTRLDGGGKIARIDINDPVHPFKVQDHLGGIGNRPAASPGIAALWHNRNAMGCTDRDTFGDLVGIGGIKHHVRVACKLATCLGIMRGQNIGLHAPAFRAKGILKFLDRAGGQDVHGGCFPLG